MKKVIILTIAVVMTATVASRSKTSTATPKPVEFSGASFSPKTFLATAD